MIEVEIKAKIEDKKSITEKIIQLNGEYSHTETQYDIYFNAPDKDYAQTDEALRIRQIPKDNGEFEKILTYKGPKVDKNTKTREEIEVEISSTDNMTDLLGKLGFKPSAIVEKKRRIFKLDDFTITIDKLEDLGEYMEIEYITGKKDRVIKAQEKIMELFKKLGIEDGFERTSYLELLRQKKDKKY